ncbi:hypothetical protein AaE_012273, partial [Aphanomyces astaci]
EPLVIASKDIASTFLEWNPLFVSQAEGHEFTKFYLNKSYVPSDLEWSILSILDDDVQVEKLKHPELYSVVADVTGDDQTRAIQGDRYSHPIGEECYSEGGNCQGAVLTTCSGAIVPQHVDGGLSAETVLQHFLAFYSF